jgi:hypothetical protein
MRDLSGRAARIKEKLTAKVGPAAIPAAVEAPKDSDAASE